MSQLLSLAYYGICIKEQESFMKLRLVANVIKLFVAVSYNSF
jgi:hypothetical protein